MSHFTSIRTRLTDRETILETLEDLGLPWDERPARGYQQRTRRTEFRIPRDDGYDIGFVPDEDGYELVADWTMSTLSARQFVQRLQRAYARRVTCRKLSEQGFELVEETVAHDGRIHLLLRRAG